VRIAPAAYGAFPFTVMNQLFIVESSRLRYGKSADGSLFLAYPDLVADTLAYAANPAPEFSVLPLPVLAPNYDRALARTRETLLGLLGTLTQHLPADPDVFEALAHVLEMRDEITGTPNGGYSAFSALERAKMLATDSTQRARLGAADVRLHLKLGDFSRAVALGDSILHSSPNASGTTAAYLMGIAALLGHEREAIGYATRSGLSLSLSTEEPIPLLEEVSTAFFMRTALGVCDDSVRVLRTRLSTLVESYVTPSRAAVVRDGLLQRPLTFAMGCLGPAATLSIGKPTMTIVSIGQALGHGDAAGARRQLDSLQRHRHLLRPGELALDHMLAEVWTRAAVGDTAAAIKQLDLTLTALPTLTPHVVYEPGMAAAVGRSMVLRAELAARHGDRGTAALWAGRLVTLWGHADPSLAPTLARMKQLAAQTP
jgi:hypothetical protein